MKSLKSILAIFLLLTKISLAQPGTNDPNFNVIDNSYYGNGLGASNVLSYSVIQADGKIIIGGANSQSSYSYNGLIQFGLSRINTDGSLDETFNIGTGFNSWTNAFALQSDGKIVVIGDFTNCNGIARNRIVRLNSDGSVDTSFIVGTGFPLGSDVKTIAIQSDGKIIVAGNFNSYNGISRSRIVRLNTDGSIDLSYVIGTGFTGLSSSKVSSIKLQSDGKLIAVGSFSTYNGTSTARIARLNTNGSRDLTFNPGTGFNGDVWDVDIQPDGKIVAVGGFTSFNGQGRSRITRLNSNGSLDVSFVIGSGFNAGNETTVKIKDDGTIMVGGTHYSYNGTFCPFLIRLNSSGGAEPVFSSNLGNALSSQVAHINIQNDGKIIVLGSFNKYTDIKTGNMLRLNVDGTLDENFNKGTGFNGFVSCIGVQTDGKILVGGDFSKYNGTVQKRITRMYPNGDIDTSFNIGNGFSNTVSSLSIQSDGKIVVAGEFDTYNGTPRTRIARLNVDGSIDLSFDPGSGFDNYVATVCVQADGKILAGGGFSSFNGNTQGMIVRLNSDGSLDTTFNSYSNNLIYSIKVQSDGKILVSGGMTFYNGTTVYKIFRLNTDGSIDPSFNPANGPNNIIFTSIVQNDGKILIGGNFTTFNGLSKNRIVRLNNNGTLDASFNIGSGFDGDVKTISIQEDGKIIVGGNFTSYNGSIVSKIVRLNINGSLDNTFISGIGFDDEVFTTFTQPDEKILVGGSFFNYNGIPRNCLAQLLNCYPSNSTISISTCDNYTLNGQNFITSGVYTQTITNSQGCDSVITLNLTIQNSNDSIYITTCDSYTWFGQVYSSSGYYTQQFTNVYGCDSIITLCLTLNTPTSSTISISACDSYVFNGNQIFVSGQYIDTIPNTVGCDSIITLNLTILNSTVSVSSISVCGSYFWPQSNQTYSLSGQYIDSIPNAAGCDSIIILNLTILQSSNDNVNVSSCYSYTWPINNQIYTTSGQYIDTILNAAGCDSIITLNLTILSSYNTDVLTACDSFTWIDGITYTSSTNTPTWTLTNASGCDSIVNLNLTIFYSNTGIDIQTACDSFTWPINNQTYTTSGQYMDTIPNAAGCDSVITLDLTIIPFLPLTISNSFSLPSDATTCVGELAVSVSGNADFELNLDNGAQIVNTSGYSLINNLCPGVHDLLVIDNCSDSLTTQFVIPIDSNYIFNNPFIDSIAVDSLGTTITNCDIYYNQIDTAYIDSIWATGNTVNVIWNIVDSNGSNFDTSSYVLNNGNGVYWLQLSVFCPTKALGDYFTVTEAIFFNDGTISMADLAENTFQFDLYPNPTNNEVTLTFDSNEAQVVIYDTQGKLIQTKTIHSGEQVSLKEVETGVYFFEVTTEKGSAVKRVVKH